DESDHRGEGGHPGQLRRGELFGDGDSQERHAGEHLTRGVLARHPAEELIDPVVRRSFANRRALVVVARRLFRHATTLNRVAHAVLTTRKVSARRPAGRPPTSALVVAHVRIISSRSSRSPTWEMCDFRAAIFEVKLSVMSTTRFGVEPPTQTVATAWGAKPSSSNSGNA